MSWAAIVRDLSPRFQDCELTHRHRRVIDMARAVEQHEAYVSLLESLGVDVHRLPPRADFPDSVFVEDTAVVADELAVMTRPPFPGFVV